MSKDVRIMDIDGCRAKGGDYNIWKIELGEILL